MLPCPQDPQRIMPLFSEHYGSIRAAYACANETLSPAQIGEEVVQALWYDRLLDAAPLETEQGHRIAIESPGFWNRQAGPDFRGAQIHFNGSLCTGDVEIHLDWAGWRAHGHHLDERYNNVILHVVLNADGPRPPVETAQGREIPTLVAQRFLRGDMAEVARLLAEEHYEESPAQPGRCAELAQPDAGDALERFLDIAGEWRMLNKARALRERMDRSGEDQALYEALMYACGFSAFKHHFQALARALPYDRARQLAHRDPMLLEAALFQLGGLLPDALPEGTTAVPHFARLRALRRDHLTTLRRLPLAWPRNNIRPNNYPERRLAGATRLIARTADTGLANTLEMIWATPMTPKKRREAFQELFPTPLGFWAEHCTWTGKKLNHPIALLGQGRIHSIIGNVFIPFAAALARRDRDRTREETIHEFFATLPKEPDKIGRAHV